MDVTQLPFNRLIGLEPVAPDSGFLVRLPDGAQYTNHLGTVHASALLAVAEAGSGIFLLRHLGSGEGFIPVVRRLEAKFRRPASGPVSARAAVDPAEVAGGRRNCRPADGCQRRCRLRSWTRPAWSCCRRRSSGSSRGAAQTPNQPLHLTAAAQRLLRVKAPSAAAAGELCRSASKCLNRGQ